MTTTSTTATQAAEQDEADIRRAVQLYADGFGSGAGPPVAGGGRLAGGADGDGLAAGGRGKPLPVGREGDGPDAPVTVIVAEAL